MALILGIAGIVCLLFLAHTEALCPQSQANADFASNPSFVSGLSHYQKTWPPVYPSLLWLFSKTKITPQYFNLLCLYLSLIVVGALCKKMLPNVHWFYVVLCIALINANYMITGQLVAELLLVLIALVILYLIVARQKPWTLRSVSLLAVISAIACLTRLFAIFWLLPLCLAYIWFDGDKSSLKKRLVNAAVYCCIVVLLISPWLLAVRLSTGWFSGMDRFAAKPFYGSADLSMPYLAGINTKFLTKTIIIDFCSPYCYASHFVLRPPLKTAELLIGFGVFFLLALTLNIFVRHWFRHAAMSKTKHMPDSRQMAPLYFTFTCLAWLMILWTLGNPDPIYTRFAYPAYPFAVFSGFMVYSWAKTCKLSLAARIPFYVLFVLICGINIIKVYFWWALKLYLKNLA